LQARARKVLQLQARDPIVKVFGGSKRWLVVPVVGLRASVRDEIGNAIDTSGAPKKLGRPLKDGRDVVEDLLRLASSGPYGGVLLVIDELGKFLEHAAATGEDIYFYQQLAEAASRSDGNLVVIGILHQAFEQYATRLGQSAREEWAKVQGRFVDIPLLAANDETIALIGRAIEVNGPIEFPRSALTSAKTAAAVIHARRPASSESLGDDLLDCWPLHPVTAALLGPSAKRRFGQNERSIFGFLTSAEPLAFRAFLAGANTSDTYRPSMYWDYLAANLEAAILSSPDSHRWSLGAEAVERAQARFAPMHVALVKTVALIELFRNGSGLASEEDLLATCVEGSKGEVQTALKELSDASILIYRRHLEAWGVYAGSDFDIEAAVQARMAERTEPDLKKMSALGELQPITARRLYSESGTMRWFTRLLAHPSDVRKVLHGIDRKGACGAFALLIPSTVEEARVANALAEEVSEEKDFARHVIGVPKSAHRLAELALELEALERVRAEERKVHDDPVARREIDSRVATTSGAVAELLRDAFLEADWYWKGKKQDLVSRSAGLSSLATVVARAIFPKSPRLFSELVNRDELSSAAAKAQRELMHRLLMHGSTARLGYEGYPAEAGLYYSLIEPTGIHRRVSGVWRLCSPNEDSPRGASLLPLWEKTHALLDTSDGPVSLADIYALWRSEPFGLKQGVMPILATAFVLSDRARIALYVEDAFTPDLTPADLDEWLQDPRRVAWRRVKLAADGQKMLRALAKSLCERLGREVSPEPLDAARAMVRLVFGLPEWTRRTNLLSDDARRMRDLLLKASDPHKVLFADLPTVLGVAADERLVERIAVLAEELERIYPATLRSVEKHLFEALDHAGGLDKLQVRAGVVQGISGDFRLDALASRLAVYSGSLPDIEGLMTLALNKPSTSWVDHDIDAAVLQLCAWAIEFRRVEALAAVRDRAPTRRAIAVVFGSGGDHGGRTVSGTFDVSTSDSPEVERVVADLLATCVQRSTKREVVLAALAEAGARLFEQQEFARSDS